MRLWTGGSGQAAAPDLPFAANVAQPLAGTGLSVTFSDAGQAGDYWIIAARPNTPDIVVPWALQQGLPPMGPLMFLAPLAVITWSLDANETPTAAVHDCRHRFRPLCETGCCCTLTVGDGETSFGDVASIQSAVDLVPDGGEICVLRGTYSEQVVLDGRHSITITGCGPGSLLTPSANAAAVLTIGNSSEIQLRELGFEALAVTAIRLDGSDAAPILHTRLDNLAIRGRDVAAVTGTGLRGFEMRRCEIDLLPLAASLADDPVIGRRPAVYLAGEDLRVADCRIEADAQAASARLPLGGVQIGGGSHRVRLCDNLIRRGNGHGVILGSIRFVRADANGIAGVAADDLTAALAVDGDGGGPFVLTGLLLTIDGHGCISIDPNPPGGPGGDDPPLVPVSEGALVDVAIRGNRIEAMGASGISVARFFDLSMGPAEYISVEGLEIAHNRILGCVTLETPTLSADLRVHSALGGIALAHCERLSVRDNRIEDCGPNGGDPVCGLFVLIAESAVVERNRIAGNGTASTEAAPARPGRRGGCVFALALPGSVPFTVPFLNRAGLRQDGAPALRVHDNVIVSPEGRALEVIAVGPVSACDNQFTSRSGARLFRTPQFQAAGAAGFGLSRASAAGLSTVAAQSGDPLLSFIDLLGGVVVAILDLGVSTEIYLQLLGFSGFNLVDPGPAGSRPFNDDDDDLFFGGEVLFDDNQVSLDALAAEVTVAVSAVLLISLDDVGMTANQCTCDLLLDFILTNALVLGFSVRLTENRFKEPVGIPNVFSPAFLSAATLALMNETAVNQGTHCFYAVGAPALSVVAPNRSLIELGQSEIVRRLRPTARRRDRQICRRTRHPATGVGHAEIRKYPGRNRQGRTGRNRRAGRSAGPGAGGRSRPAGGDRRLQAADGGARRAARTGSGPRPRPLRPRGPPRPGTGAQIGAPGGAHRPRRHRVRPRAGVDPGGDPGRDGDLGPGLGERQAEARRHGQRPRRQGRSRGLRLHRRGRRLLNDGAGHAVGSAPRHRRQRGGALCRQRGPRRRARRRLLPRHPYRRDADRHLPPSRRRSDGRRQAGHGARPAHRRAQRGRGRAPAGGGRAETRRAHRGQVGAAGRDDPAPGAGGERRGGAGQCGGDPGRRAQRCRRAAAGRADPRGSAGGAGQGRAERRRHRL